MEPKCSPKSFRNEVGCEVPKSLKIDDSTTFLKDFRFQLGFPNCSKTLRKWLPKTLRGRDRRISLQSTSRWTPGCPPRHPRRAPGGPRTPPGGPRLRPKRPQDPPKTPQGAPREPQGRPKEPSGSPQDPPRRPPRSDFLPGPPQEADLGSIWGRLGVNLGTFLIRFWAEVGSKLSQHVCNFEVLFLYKKT